METQKDRQTNKEFVYVKSIDMNIEIIDISNFQNLETANNEYRVGDGDQIAITVWGLQEIFPIANMNQDLNLRRVDSNGIIFFPYAGLVMARGKTQNELRSEITEKLSNNFNEPQVDVTIARFNSQKVYLLGEVTNPTKINLSDISLSLSEALGEASGLATNSSSGSEVFIIRNNFIGDKPVIFRADLSSPSGFIASNNFYLADNDIVYINANGTTRWNRVVSQFFPFSSFLNSVDRLIAN